MKRQIYKIELDDGSTRIFYCAQAAALYLQRNMSVYDKTFYFLYKQDPKDLKWDCMEGAELDELDAIIEECFSRPSLELCDEYDAIYQKSLQP